MRQAHVPPVPSSSLLTSVRVFTGNSVHRGAGGAGGHEPGAFRARRGRQSPRRAAARPGPARRRRPAARDPAVRRLAERVVREHDERSLTGAVAAGRRPRARSSASWWPTSPASGRCSRYLDDPAVEEIWINDPSRVFVARNGRHELTHVILTARAGRRSWSSGCSSPAAGASTSASRSSTRCCPAATGCTSCSTASRGFTAVNIRKFVVKAARLDDLVDARQPDAAGGRVPRRVGARPGSTSWSPAGRRPARPRC